MKKLFTLTLLAVLVSLGANAQGLRKTWDFRNGFSQKTVNALKADQEEFGDSKYWRNYESDAAKADSKHFWNASADFKNADKMACTHNGGVEKVIEELEGLRFTSSTAAKKVVMMRASRKMQTVPTACILMAKVIFGLTVRMRPSSSRQTAVNRSESVLSRIRTLKPAVSH